MDIFENEFDSLFEQCEMTVLDESTTLFTNIKMTMNEHTKNYKEHLKMAKKEKKAGNTSAAKKEFELALKELDKLKEEGNKIPDDSPFDSIIRIIAGVVGYTVTVAGSKAIVASNPVVGFILAFSGGFSSGYTAGKGISGLIDKGYSRKVYLNSLDECKKAVKNMMD